MAGHLLFFPVNKINLDVNICFVVKGIFGRKILKKGWGAQMTYIEGTQLHFKFNDL